MMLAYQKIFGDSLTQKAHVENKHSNKPTKRGFVDTLYHMGGKLSECKDIGKIAKRLLDLCRKEREECEAVVKLHYLMKYFSGREDL